MNRPFLNAYVCLNEIFRSKAFSTIQLNNTLIGCKNADKALTTKIVYGVLDTNIELEYIIENFAKKIKPVIKIILKIGVYCLKYLSIPVYAVINDCAELTKTTGKKELVGFVNATLRSIYVAINENKIVYPKQFNRYLSTKYSFPLWATEKLLKQYGNEKTENLLKYSPKHYTHVRVNTSLISDTEFEKELTQNNITFEKSVFNDTFNLNGSLDKLDSTHYTIQSLGSMLVAMALNVSGTSSVLDLCSAPGGKAVYIAQLDKDCQVTACDIYPHRVELINSYANRMNVKNVTTSINDATVLNEKFVNRFDYVLCDVPCSGFGVYFSKPDIKLFREPSNVIELSVIQKNILEVASKYVKVGGIIVYSTCTIFDEENINVVNEFLANNNDFAFDDVSLPSPFGLVNGHRQFLPSTDNVEGYFIARLVRKK